MAISHFIEPFPADIDRDYFGTWLSGFTDGEGCFFLGLNRNMQTRWKQGILHSFAISVRDDDFAVLQIIHSFFQCGLLRSKKATGGRGNKKPCAVFAVYNVTELMTCIIPHFERYPLLAKKSRDFQIWKQGVEFAHSIKSRPTLYEKRQGGRQSKWTREQIKHFAAISDALRSQRQYEPSSIAVPPLQDFEQHIWDSLFPD